MGTQAFVNGRIFTGRSEDDFATALAVVDGRVERVGDADLLTAEERSGAHDLGGRTVLPGLLDVHVHQQYAVALLVAAYCCRAPAHHYRDGRLTAH